MRVVPSGFLQNTFRKLDTLKESQNEPKSPMIRATTSKSVVERSETPVSA